MILTTRLKKPPENRTPIIDTPPLAPPNIRPLCWQVGKAARPPAKLSSARHRTATATTPGARRASRRQQARFRVGPTGQPCPPTDDHSTASRYRMAAWVRWSAALTGLPSASCPPGESFGLAGPPGTRPNPCRNPYAAGLAPSLYVSYGPCSSVPASGCHHRPVPDDPTGLPEQALNLLLLVVSPSGTRKTRTKSPRVTLSGRSTDNLESGRPDNPPVSLNHQSSIANRQSPAPPQRSRLPMTTALPPPARRPLLRHPRPPEVPS